MATYRFEGKLVPGQNRHGIDWKTSTSRNGFRLDEVLSAVIKEIRRSKEEEALYWALEMTYAGQVAEDFLWESLLVFTIEDVSIAAPSVLTIVSDAYRLKSFLPERDTRRLAVLAFAVSELSKVAKSRYSNELLIDLQERIAAGEFKPSMPDYALDMHTARGRERRRGIEHYLTEGALLEKEGTWPGHVYRNRLFERFVKK